MPRESIPSKRVTKPGVKYAIQVAIRRRNINILANIATVTLTCCGTAPGTTTPNSDVSFNQIPLYRLPHKACKLGIASPTSTPTPFDIMIPVDMDSVRFSKACLVFPFHVQQMEGPGLKALILFMKI